MTQSVRRMRGGKGAAFGRGLALAVGATAAAVLLFAVIIGFTDPGDGVIRVINQLIKLGAIFLGVRSMVKRGDESGIRRGALLGFVYMGVGVLLYALLSGQQVSWMGYLIDVLMGVAAGGLSGMLLGR